MLTGTVVLNQYRDQALPGGRGQDGCGRRNRGKTRPRDGAGAEKRSGVVEVPGHVNEGRAVHYGGARGSYYWDGAGGQGRICVDDGLCEEDLVCGDQYSTR